MLVWMVPDNANIHVRTALLCAFKTSTLHVEVSMPEVNPGCVGCDARITRLEEKAKYEEQMRSGDHEETIVLLNAINESLNGNGSPGLKTRMKVVEETTTRHSKILWWLGTTTLGSVLTLSFLEAIKSL